MILSGVLNTHPDCLATNCNWQDLLTVARPLLVTVGPPTMELLAREVVEDRYNTAALQ